MPATKYCLLRLFTALAFSIAWENSRHLAGDVTTGFPAKWCLRNERRNSILMTRHYPDLGSPSDRLNQITHASRPFPSFHSPLPFSLPRPPRLCSDLFAPTLIFVRLVADTFAAGTLRWTAIKLWTRMFCRNLSPSSFPNLQQAICTMMSFYYYDLNL